MERVVIWGGGFQGKKVYDLLTNYYTDDYEVVGISDSNPEVVKGKWADILPVYHHSETKKRFDDDFFDVALIGVSPKYSIQDVFKEIRGYGIKTINLEDWNTVSAAEKCNRSIKLGDGRKAYYLNNIHVVYDAANLLGWIYDENNNVYVESANPIPAFTSSLPYATVPFVKNRRNIIKDEVCLLAKQNSINYSHFLYEVLPVLYLMEKKGYTGKYMLISTNHSRQFSELLNISADRIIWLNDDGSDIEYFVEKGILFQPQSWERHINDENNTANYEDVLREMAEFFWDAIGLDKQKISHERIYIAREGRICTNIQDSEWLVKWGFRTCRNEEITVKDQIRIAYNADIMMCTHGAAAGNVIFMRPGTCVIETFPRRFTPYWTYVYCLFNDIRYQMVVEYDAPWLFPEALDKPSFRDYTIDIGLLEIAISNAEVMLP